MRELIELIQSKNLTNAELVAKLEEEYNQSKTIRQRLQEDFDEFTKTLKDYDAEYDPGLDSVFYMRTATQDYNSFSDDIKDNAEGRKETVWDFAAENTINGWEMQRSYYSYKAYQRVLEDNLRKMSYSYTD